MSNKKIMRMMHHFKQWIRSSEDLISLVPTKDDTIYSILLKTVSLVERFHSYFFGKPDAINVFFESLDVEKKSNIHFVNLFLKTLKEESLCIKKFPINTEIFCTKIEVPGVGDLYFLNDILEQGRYLSSFYYSKGFNFKVLLDKLWKRYDGRIYIAMEAEGWKRTTMFLTFPLPEHPTYGSSQEALASLKAKNKQYREDGISRAYLLLGEPGTGKSTFSLQMATEDERVLKIDAQGLETMDIDSVEFLLDNLQPSFVLVDDIDKILFGSSVATLLYILEFIKLKFPKTTVLLTANEINRMDPAILRPGRIDEIFEFICSPKDRKDIFQGYLEIFNIELTDKQLKEAVDCMDGLSGAYVKEFVIQLKYTPFQDVVESFNKRRRLLGFLDEEEVEEAEEVKEVEEKRKPAKKILRRK